MKKIINFLYLKYLFEKVEIRKNYGNTIPQGFSIIVDTKSPSCDNILVYCLKFIYYTMADPFLLWQYQL